MAGRRGWFRTGQDPAQPRHDEHSSNMEAKTGIRKKACALEMQVGEGLRAIGDGHGSRQKSAEAQCVEASAEAGR